MENTRWCIHDMHFPNRAMTTRLKFWISELRRREGGLCPDATGPGKPSDGRDWLGSQHEATPKNSGFEWESRMRRNAGEQAAQQSRKMSKTSFKT